MKAIMIDEGDFEHLLNCMANQKFIHEQNAETQKEWQDTIDQAWNKGMQKLSEHRSAMRLCNWPPPELVENSYNNVHENLQKWHASPD